MSKAVTPTVVNTTEAQKALKWAIDILDIRLKSNAVVELASKSVMEQRKLYTKHRDVLSVLLEETNPVG